MTPEVEIPALLVPAWKSAHRATSFWGRPSVKALLIVGGGLLGFGMVLLFMESRPAAEFATGLGPLILVFSLVTVAIRFRRAQALIRHLSDPPS